MKRHARRRVAIQLAESAAIRCSLSLDVDGLAGASREIAALATIGELVVDRLVAEEPAATPSELRHHSMHLARRTHLRRIRSATGVLSGLRPGMSTHSGEGEPWPS